MNAKMPDLRLEKAPPVQRLESVNDLYDIAFSEEGLASVEVPFALLDSLPLVNEARGPGPRLSALVSLIRQRGYVPETPIICRVGMKGRWVVVDGGHRITAARIVGNDFWARFFGRKVQNLHFLLFTTPESWSKLRPPAGPGGL
ncbi:MAG: ParB/Srx family N-terminal domain-containing protein [Pseudomonadota bacterium]